MIRWMLAASKSFRVVPGTLLFSATLYFALSQAEALTTTSTTMTVTVDGSTVSAIAAHHPVTLTATVTAGPIALTRGQVNFCNATAVYCEDVHILGSAQITAAGKATLIFYPAAGEHSYRAVFSGTTSYSGSASVAAPLAVVAAEPYATKSALTATGAAGSYSLTASVTGKGTTAPATGEVYLLDRSNGNAELGKAALPKGIPDVGFEVSPVGQLQHPRSGYNLATADFNNDGKPDLATFSGTLPSVLLGNGDGTFSEVPSSPDPVFSIQSVFAADFNADGNADLIATYSAEPSEYRYTEVFLGDGKGGFAKPHRVTSVTIEAVGDFDHDGLPDLLVYLETAHAVKIQHGNGDGFFTDGWQSPRLTTIAYGIENGVAVGDFNGDGLLDFAWTYFPTPLQRTDVRHLTAYLNQGAGTFREEDFPLATPQAYEVICSADFNGDGRQDILVLDINDNLATQLLANADGTFSQRVLDGFSEFATSVLVADLNQDGVADLMMNFNIPPEEQVLLGNGDGTFTKAGSIHPGVDDVYYYAVLSGDFDGDGISDVAALYSGKYLALLARPRQKATVTVSSKAPVGPGAHEVVARYEGDGNFSGSVSLPVSLSAPSNAPVATLSATLLQFSSDQPLTVPSAAKTVTLTNTGTAPLSIGSLAVVPVNGFGASFASSNTCPKVLAAGSACNIRVRFVPFSDGPKISRLVITDNAGNSPQAITLSGKSAGTPEVSLSAASLVFAQRVTYTQSDPQTITVTNTGNAALHFHGIALSSGSIATNFRASNNCHEGLAAGESCTVRVRFTPYSKEPLVQYSGFLIFTDDAEGKRQYVSIQGVSTSK